MNKIASAVVLVIVSTFLLSETSATAQQYVYPQKGQSAEQQKKDEYECHGWAVKQTGFDPTRRHRPPRSSLYSSRQGHSRAPGPEVPRAEPLQARRSGLSTARQARAPGRCRRRCSCRQGAEQKAGAAAAGIGTAAGIDPAERQAAELSQGKGRLPRGERLLCKITVTDRASMKTSLSGFREITMSKSSRYRIAVSSRSLFSLHSMLTRWRRFVPGMVLLVLITAATSRPRRRRNLPRPPPRGRFRSRHTSGCRTSTAH